MGSRAMMMRQDRFLDGKTVLFAYEHKLTHDLLISTLKQSGAGTTYSGTPADMLARLKDFKPDIIICEYAMEPVNGGAFVRFIRQKMAITVPVVMLINTGDREAQAQARLLDIEQTLTIPFATNDVLTALKKVSGGGKPVVRRELNFGG